MISTTLLCLICPNKTMTTTSQVSCHRKSYSMICYLSWTLVEVLLISHMHSKQTVQYDTKYISSSHIIYYYLCKQLCNAEAIFRPWSLGHQPVVDQWSCLTFNSPRMQHIQISRCTHTRGNRARQHTVIEVHSPTNKMFGWLKNRTYFFETNKLCRV